MPLDKSVGALSAAGRKINFRYHTKFLENVLKSIRVLLRKLRGNLSDLNAQNADRLKILFNTIN